MNPMNVYYYRSSRVLVSILFFFLFKINESHAQRHVTDTLPSLSKLLDTTPVPPAPVHIDEGQEIYDEEEDIEEESEDEESVFDYIWVDGKRWDSSQAKVLPTVYKQKLKEDKDFWYANTIFQKKEKDIEKEDASFGVHPVVRTLIWFLIIGGFAAFLIIFLYNSNAGLFRKSKRIKGVQQEVEEQEDIFEINYPKEINNAVSAGNYRLGVRLLFLQLLSQLANKKEIEYKQSHTNFDYLLQLQSTALYKDFFQLTRSYEYSWYGYFDLSEQQFRIIKNDFEDFQKRFI